MEQVDLAVVGGGPAGAIVAREAAAGGARVVLFERAPNAPLRCAGLISTRAVEELGVPRELILSEIRGVTIYGPEGSEASLSSSLPKGAVIDRVRFDAYLRGRAREEGVRVMEGVSVLGWDGNALYTSAGTFRPGILVGADGAVSGVARWAGLPRPRETLVAYQAEVVAQAEEPHHVEIFLGRDHAPGFFAWTIPAGETIRIGLATIEAKEAPRLLHRLLARRFPHAPVGRVSGGLIPIGPPGSTSKGRVFLVGDAAAQVKPLTGGGLYYGGLAARLLGRLISAGNPGEYERSWREELGREIEFGLRARRAILLLSDAELDRLVRLLRDRTLSTFLIERGDMDYPSRLVPELKRSPQLWAIGLKALAAVGGLSRFHGLLSELH
ncbi:geranylgeranyl reductase family protein [Candidatus Bipolaricaulota sp. J31]